MKSALKVLLYRIGKGKKHNDYEVHIRTIFSVKCFPMKFKSYSRKLYLKTFEKKQQQLISVVTHVHVQPELGTCLHAENFVWFFTIFS